MPPGTIRSFDAERGFGAVGAEAGFDDLDCPPQLARPSGPDPALFSPPPSEDLTEDLDLALAHLAGGQSDSALQQLLAILEGAPDRPDVHFHLARTQMKLGAPEPAETALRAALHLNPNHAGAAHALGFLLLIYSDRIAEAMLWLRHAAGLEPDVAGYQQSLGMGLLFTGELDAARLSLTRACELDRTLYDSLFSLVSLTSMNADSPETRALWERLEIAVGDKSAPLLSQAKAAQAMGKALNDVGRHLESFARFTEGGRLAQEGHPYDIDAAERHLAEIAGHFDADLMRRLAGAGDPSTRPIFVVGMPRSGSTLVEAILAAHPKVYPGGELQVVPDMVAQSRGPCGESYPHWTTALNEQDCLNLGGAYLRRAPAGVLGVTRVIDKQLVNIAHIGLIRLILPQARVIHVRRDPRDVALSCFTSGLSNMREHGYVSDLSQLGRYWRAYDALMAHWRRIVPSEVMLEVAYEDIVSQPEFWARRMVDHCDLDWTPQCLNFHHRRHSVHTASAAQIRQPVHGRSVGRWKLYADQLAPFIEASVSGLAIEAASPLGPTISGWIPRPSEDPRGSVP
ncbi:MAG: sulfotransferase [Caulobacteraceae bacterium]|nr:sulfotransferase [Caulobacteraceae bacterium]